jgi:uncharacterized protein YcbX
MEVESARRRSRFGQQLVFGQNMIPDGPGSIRVGYPVHVLERSGTLPADIPTTFK